MALALLGPKSLDQGQWVEAIIRDIFQAVQYKDFLEPQLPQRLVKLPCKEVSFLSLELFKNTH